MDKSCSLFGLGGISCGEFRGASSLVGLGDCVEDTSVHLHTCHLSKSGLSEFQLILARVGLFDTSLEMAKTMSICPNHRAKLGRYWRPLRSCQYPAHRGSIRSYKNRNVVNIQLSKEMNRLYGTLVQIGSRKYCFIIQNCNEI